MTLDVLGISALYHDAAACLVREGRIVASAQEERFTRIKFDPSIPVNAARYCLQSTGLFPTDITCLAYYEIPEAKLKRIVSALSHGVGDLRRVVETWPDKLAPLELIAHKLCLDLKAVDARTYEHHRCHAASAFLPSPFDSAAVLTVDGVGEWATTSTFMGQGGKLEKLHSVDYPHSIGLFYSAITSYLGFVPNSDEYKVMGLAARGKPRYLDRLRHVLRSEANGAFTLGLEYFNYNERMYSESLVDLLRLPARAPDAPVTAAHADIAASAQRLLEQTLIAICNELYRQTGSDNLCLAGGVALNCVANSRIRTETKFSQVFVQPAAGDAGGAIGAALLASHEIAEERRCSGARLRKARQNDGPLVKSALPRYPLLDAFLGPKYASTDIRRYLKRLGLRYHKLSRARLVQRVAKLIANGNVVGWFEGRMEWGPRALGARSILADPRLAEMRKQLNQKIKRRESFRPFAPICLASRAAEFFEASCPEPYMTFTVKVREPRCLAAVTHVDGTARLQTMDDTSRRAVVDLLRAFDARTGVPVLINTSFNMAGDPIVCSPADAFDCFREAHIDALVLEDLLVIRTEQSEELVAPGTRPYMSIVRELHPYVRDTYFFT